MHALSALALGANGFLSTEANSRRACLPVADRRTRAGDHAGAEAAYARILALMTGMGDVPGMSVRYVKAAMAALGTAAARARTAPAARADELARSRSGSPISDRRERGARLAVHARRDEHAARQRVPVAQCAIGTPRRRCARRVGETFAPAIDWMISQADAGWRARSTRIRTGRPSASTA